MITRRAVYRAHGRYNVTQVRPEPSVLRIAATSRLLTRWRATAPVALSPRRIDATLVLFVVAVSAASALLAFRESSDYVMPDSHSYVVPARNLASGRGFIGEGVATTFTESIPRFPNVPGPEAQRTPVYPALLAVFFAAGAGFRGVVLFQHLLNIAVAVSLYFFLVSAVGWRSIAGTAASLYAVFPATAQVANQVLAETVATALLLAALIAVEVAIRRQSAWLATLAGLFLSMSVLTRPIAMYFVIPLAAVVAWCSIRRRVVLAIALLVSSQIFPMAWICRNKFATGEATMTTVSAENLLFEFAASVHVTRNESHLFRMTAAQQQLGFRSALHRARLPLFYQAMAIARADGRDPTKLNAAQKAEYVRRLAVHILRQQPIAFAEIFVSGLVELLLFAPASMALHYPVIPRSAETAFVFATALSLLLVFAGVKAVHRRNRALAALIAVTIGYFALTAAIPEATIRYALVYAPMYAAGVAAGLAASAPRAALYARRGLARARARRTPTIGPS